MTPVTTKGTIGEVDKCLMDNYQNYSITTRITCAGDPEGIFIKLQIFFSEVNYIVFTYLFFQ